MSHDSTAIEPFEGWTTEAPSHGDLMRQLIRDIEAIDTRHPSESRRVDVLIDDGVIAGVGRGLTDPDAQTVDGEGRFALPGLINAHDHLYSHELRHPVPELGLAGMRAWLDRRSVSETLATMQANAMRRLSQGIVVERDLGAHHGLNVDLSRLIDAGLVPGPKVVAAGRPIVMTGGHVYTFGREADGPWDCRAAVREQAKVGAKVVKVMASGGVSRYPDEDFGVAEFSSDELLAIVDEAHRRNLPTCAHAFGGEAVRSALEAGIDSIEHGVTIGDEELEKMVESGTGYVPTLSNMRRVAAIAREQAEVTGQRPVRFEELTRGVVDPHAETFRRAVAAGVKVGIGTDSTGDFSEELEVMGGLGMTSEALIRAATLDGADICRVRAGVIEEGRLGGILLYERDPRTDPTALARPDVVLHRGCWLDHDWWARWRGIIG